MGGQTKKIKWDSAANKHCTTGKRGPTHCVIATAKGESEHKRSKLGTEIELLKSKPTRAINKIIEGRVPTAKADLPPQPETKLNGANTGQTKGDGRVLPHELLDNGQGKSVSDMDISENSGSGMDQSGSNSNKTAPKGSTPSTKEWDGHVLLCPPIIKATGKIATGATTPKLCKQNKLHRTEALLQQPIVSQ